MVFEAPQNQNAKLKRSKMSSARSLAHVPPQQIPASIQGIGSGLKLNLKKKTGSSMSVNSVSKRKALNSARGPQTDRIEPQYDRALMMKHDEKHSTLRYDRVEPSRRPPLVLIDKNDHR